jgi:hypothetical protein
MSKMQYGGTDDREKIREAIDGYKTRFGENSVETILCGFDADTLPEELFEQTLEFLAFEPAQIAAVAKHEAGKLLPPKSLDEFAQRYWASRRDGQ